MNALAWMTALVLAAPQVPSDTALLAHVMRLPCHRIDPRLGSEPFEAWLRKTLGPGAEISWTTDDCGEGGDGPVPICVTAEARLSSHGHVVVSIVVGTSDSGLVGEPELWFGQIRGVGPTELLGKDGLHRLPAMLAEAQRRDLRLSRLPDRQLDEYVLIEAVRHVRASTLDARLPDTTFGDWMTARAGPRTALRWSIEGCGHNGPPVDLGGTNDEWAYVAASFDDPTVGVRVQIRVGTCRKGALEAPAVTSVSVYDKRPGHIHIEPTPLGNLPAMLGGIRR